MPSDTRQFDQRSGGGSGTWGDVTRRMDMDVSSVRQSGLAPVDFTTGTHLSISAWTKRVNSAGVMVLDSAPISSQRLTTAGSFSTACISVASRSTIGCGVLAGTEMPNHE